MFSKTSPDACGEVYYLYSIFYNIRAILVMWAMPKANYINIISDRISPLISRYIEGVNLNDAYLTVAR